MVIQRNSNQVNRPLYTIQLLHEFYPHGALCYDNCHTLPGFDLVTSRIIVSHIYSLCIARLSGMVPILQLTSFKRRTPCSFHLYLETSKYSTRRLLLGLMNTKRHSMT